MLCLNCTSRVLRIFLHDSIILPLRPLCQPLQPQFRGPVTLLGTYSRLSSHLASTVRQQQLRNQSSLAKSELTDDDYVPFVYPAHLTVPVGEGGVLGGGNHSGWPPPIPGPVEGLGSEGGLEVGAGGIGFEDNWYEPDIELTEPYEAGEWWDNEAEVEEMTAGEDNEGEWDLILETSEESIEAVPTGGRILTRAGSWTLDSSPIVHIFHTGSKGKRPAVVARKEMERLKKEAAEAATGYKAKRLGKMYSGSWAPGKVVLRPKRPIKRTPFEKWNVNQAEYGENSPPYEKSQELARQAQNISRDGEIEPRTKRPAQDRNGEERDPYVEKNVQSKEGMEFSGRKNPPKKHEKSFTKPLGDWGCEKQRPYEREPCGLEKEPGSLSEQRWPAPRKTRDHWVLPTVDTTPEPTRLQKWIANQPRNTIEPWKIHKARLQTKFMGAKWTPLKKLSPEAQETVRVLHKNHPECTTPVLAERFEVSPEAIRRILKSKWRAGAVESEEEWAERWKKRGDRVWKRWVEMGAVQTKQMKEQKRREYNIKHKIRKRGVNGKKNWWEYEHEVEKHEKEVEEGVHIGMADISGKIL